MDWKEGLMREATEIVANRFNISPNDDGNYNTNSYDWEAGCYCNGSWLCPKDALRCIEEFIDNNEYIFQEYYE
jgi:hypothetical protein